MADADFSAASLREQFDYDPLTGILTRKPCQWTKWQPAPVNTKHSRGYLVASFNGKVCKAHRLAWLHYYGKWPEMVIDHINRIKTDNRIENLRDVSQAVNLENIERPSRFGGVHYCAGRTKPYRARVRDGKKMRHLGYFETSEQAAQACSAHFGVSTQDH